MWRLLDATVAWWSIALRFKFGVVDTSSAAVDKCKQGNGSAEEEHTHGSKVTNSQSCQSP